MKVIKLFALASCVSLMGMDAVAQRKTKKPERTLKYKMDVTEKVGVNKIKAPAGNKQLTGISSLFRQDWRELVIKVKGLQCNSPKVKWADQMTVSYDIYIPKPKSSKVRQKGIRIKEETVTYTNIPLNKAFNLNLYVHPVVYERYIVDAGVPFTQACINMTIKVDGVDVTSKPYRLKLGSADAPRGMWEAEDDKFEVLADKEGFILNRTETPFKFDNTNEFLTIKKKQDN